MPFCQRSQLPEPPLPHFLTRLKTAHQCKHEALLCDQCSDADRALLMLCWRQLSAGSCSPRLRVPQPPSAR